MATTTDLSVLKINYLTQAQYNTALSNNTVNPDEIYFTPVSTLSIADGGTGMTSNPSMLTNLGSTTAANVFQASPRPGVTGTLPIGNGGTGNTSARPAFHALTAGLTEGTAVPTDNTVFMCGNTSEATNDWYYKKFSTVWTYIKGKINANAAELTGYVKKSGDTMTGDLTLQKSTSIATNAAATLNFQVLQTDNSITNTNCYIKVYDDGDAYNYGSNMVIQSASGMIIGGGEGPSALYENAIKGKTADANNTMAGANACEFAQDGENLFLVADTNIYFLTNTQTIANRNLCYLNTSGYLYTTRTYGAVWNDYAEYRSSNVTEPGRCIKEVGDDTLELATERLQPGCEIISDTFGFAIGETKNAQTPVASNGRVLAYPFEDREEFKKHIGEPVCSGPNGTVSIMTEEEWQKYPHCIIGTISAVPDYEEWGTDNIKVDGRIWIRIR